MPIQISCPSCGRQLRVPDNLVGQMVKCPSCQNTFTASVEEPPGGGAREEFQERARPPPPRPPERERPTRPPRDDFDDRDRPSRRRYQPHRGSVILILGILSLVGIGAPVTG